MASDFVPKRRLLSSVTNALRAIVTTIEDHGYETGQVVRLIVPLAYGMDLNYVQARINVLSNTEFETDVNTENLLPYVTPTFPPGFTEAQVVPITGTTDNIAGQT